MIKIEIDYDFILKVENISSIQRGVPGVYIFLDDSNKPLYVGIAKDVKSRVESHLLKNTNTKRFSHHFKKVALIHEGNKVKRQVAETFLINTLEPPINKNGRFPIGLKSAAINGIAKFNRCKGLTNEGERCQKTGHSNGYCHYHGGNGISITALKIKNEESFMERNFPDGGTEL